jgi:hypothetical protein
VTLCYRAMFYHSGCDIVFQGYYSGCEHPIQGSDAPSHLLPWFISGNDEPFGLVDTPANISFSFYSIIRSRTLQDNVLSFIVGCDILLHGIVEGIIYTIILVVKLSKALPTFILGVMVS